MSALLSRIEIEERVRVLKLEAQWQRRLADKARRDLNNLKRHFPADGLSQIRQQEELEFRKAQAKRFAAEARALESRIK